MTISPNTRIILLKSPISLDFKNQLTFRNKEEQFNFFYNLPKLEIDNTSYVRAENRIRFPGHYDDIVQYNYCMYQNSNYSNKWFFCFISNIEYANDNLSYIYITSDYWQTWQFDIIFKDSFIEREMVNPSLDVAGNNLIPEGLETGEYKVAQSFGHSLFDPVWCIAYLGDTAGGELVGQGAYIVNRYFTNSIIFNCDYFKRI